MRPVVMVVTVVLTQGILPAVQTLAQRIQWILTELRISQRELSRRAGLAEVHVGQILRRLENNHDAQVEVGTLNAIADAARVSRAWLISGSGTPSDQPPPEPGEPRFGDLPQWSRLAQQARTLDPSLPDWVLTVVATWHTQPDVPPNAALVADLGRLALKYYTPPGEATETTSGTRRRTDVPDDSPSAAGGQRR